MTVKIPNNLEDQKCNAEFIAHSRTDMERLIAAVEVMRESLDNIRLHTAFWLDRDQADLGIKEADAILEGK
jgi:hypothetical protein